MIKPFQIHDLTIQLNGINDRTIVDHLSLTLNPLDRLAIIGEEGCGKTTLLQHLYDPTHIDGYATSSCNRYTHGQITYLQQHLSDTELNQTLSSYFFMDANGTIDYDRLEHYGQFQRYAIDHGIPSSWFDQDPPLAQLSGGMRMRYRLMIAMYDCVDTLILDEPTNDLDIPSIQSLIDMLLDLSCIIIFVSHDTHFLSKVATMILEMRKIDWLDHNEVILSKMDYLSYRTYQKSSYDHQLQIYESQKRRQHQRQQKLQQIRNKVEYAQNQAVRDPISGRKLAKKIKAINRQMDTNANNVMDKPTDVSAIPLAFHDQTKQSKSLLYHHDYDGLTIADHVLLHGFTMTLHTHETISIVGENGCGKTTLIHRLVHDLTPFYTVGYLPQSLGETIDPLVSPYDNLSSALGNDKTMCDMITTTLSALHLSIDEIHRPYQDLSQGTLTKCQLAKMVIQPPDIMILDEPTRNISPLSVDSLIHLLQSYHGCLIIVSHDRYFLTQLTTTCYWFDQKQLIRSTIDEYLLRNEPFLIK